MYKAHAPLRCNYKAETVLVNIPCQEREPAESPALPTHGAQREPETHLSQTTSWRQRTVTVFIEIFIYEWGGEHIATNVLLRSMQFKGERVISMSYC